MPSRRAPSRRGRHLRRLRPRRRPDSVRGGTARTRNYDHAARPGIRACPIRSAAALCAAAAAPAGGAAAAAAARGHAAGRCPAAAIRPGVRLAGAGRLRRRRAGAEGFLRQFPNDGLAGNAQYWLGETYYVRQDYQNAAIAFGEGFQRYPKSAKAPDNRC